MPIGPVTAVSSFGLPASFTAAQLSSVSGGTIGMQNDDLVPERSISGNTLKVSCPPQVSTSQIANAQDSPDSTGNIASQPSPSSSTTIGVLSPIHHLPPPPLPPPLPPPSLIAQGGAGGAASPPVTEGPSRMTPLSSAPATPSSSSPSSSSIEMRPNQVRSVMLNGVPIVALVIDGKERLCLAQISNTLLKSFSYNEIHNRRVALGITCVQCTPVQLEILRRAGAMPISSRRCGMITKREAERLCKSFLTENCPPKLPDNFCFDCYHECAWGSRGSFMPSRYNSSRAKCIKCAYCNLFFSPNKFIFHSHRLPESKYVQPDAANFNSWRRHLKLSGTPPEEVAYAWEDVKAMFNGGSRKRVMAHCGARFNSLKRSRSDSISSAMVSPPGLHPHHHHHHPATTSGDAKALTYVPVLPYATNKPYNGTVSSSSAVYLPRAAPAPSGGVGFPSAIGSSSGGGPNCSDKNLAPSTAPPSFVDYVWAGKPAPGAALPHSTYGFLWPRQQVALSAPELKLSPGGFYEDRNGFRDDTSDSSHGNCDSELETPVARRSLSSCSEPDFRSSDNDEAASICPSGRRSKDSGFFGSLHQPGGDKPAGYCSAFRPVVRSGTGGTTLHTVESMIRPSPTSGKGTPELQSAPQNELFRTGPYANVVAPGGYFAASDRNDSCTSSKDSSRNSSKSADSENVIDVELMDDCKEDDRLLLQNNGPSSPTLSSKKTGAEVPQPSEAILGSDDKGHQISEMRPWSGRPLLGPLSMSNASSTMELKRTSTGDNQSAVQVRCVRQLSPIESSEGRPNLPLDLENKKQMNLTKEELEEILHQETQARKRAEKQCEIMKEILQSGRTDSGLNQRNLSLNDDPRQQQKDWRLETFQEQMKREVAYREEITKQLEVVKETLCNELDQERKARFAVLQKLKEAHDALHHFSCKMLIPRQCAECSTAYKPILPP